MKSILTTAAVLTILTLGGCGGSGGDTGKSGSSTTPRENVTYQGSIALWDYLVPAGDATNQYIKTTGDQVQKYSTRFVRTNNSVTETSEISPGEKTVYTNRDNTIRIDFFTDDTPNGTVEMKARVDIGDIVTVKKSDCRLARQLATFTYEGRKYQDVIEIDCGNQPGYYQKGVGEIMQQKKLTTNGTEVTKVLTK